MKVKQQFPFQGIFALTILVYIMLDCRYSLPMNNLLRWICPVLLLVMTAIKTRMLAIKQDSLYYIILAVFGVSSVYSPYVIYSLQRFFSFVLVTSAYMVYYTYLHKKQKLEAVLTTIGIQFIIYELCNFVFEDSVNDRARGITGNSNSLGVWSNIAFVFAIYFFMKAKYTWGKLGSALLMAISVITALGSGSRTYTICILLNIVVALVLLSPRNKRVVYLFFAIVILVVSWGFLEQFVMNLQGIRRLFEQGTNRDILWEAGVYLWKQHPIRGWGYGTSQKLNNFALLGHLIGEENFGYAFHNSYLTVLIETGIIGLVAISFYVIHILKKGISAYLKQRNQELLIIMILSVNMLLCFWGGSAMTSVGSTEGFFFWGLLIWIDVYANNSQVYNHGGVRKETV